MQRWVVTWTRATGRAADVRRSRVDTLVRNWSMMRFSSRQKVEDGVSPFCLAYGIVDRDADVPSRGYRALVLARGSGRHELRFSR